MLGAGRTPLVTHLEFNSKAYGANRKFHPRVPDTALVRAAAALSRSVPYMKVLVITAHVRSDSYCHALAGAYAQGAREAGCTVQELSLATMRFDPDVHTRSPLDQPLEPDLQAALEALEWAQHWVFVFPSWWGTGPARLKGFLDRVLLPGRAFREKANGQLEGLMGGRTAHVLNTLDMPPWVYRWIQRAPSHQALRRSVLGVCGVRCTRCIAFGAVNHSTAEQRSAWLAVARALGRSLATGALRLRQRVMDTVFAWLRALRLQFYPMSWMAYTVGALAASHSAGGWQRSSYWLGYATLFFVKAATVLSNERHDFASDSVNRMAGPFNGGSRVLVDGSLNAVQLRAGSLLLLMAALATAVPTLIGVGDGAAYLVLLATVVAALGYTAPPLKLSWRGFGEIDVAFTHSLCVVLWGYVLQGGHWRDVLPWALSLPIGLSILPSIVLSSLPDAAADRQAGKRTLAVRFGRERARALAAVSALAANLAAYAVERAGWVQEAFAAVLPWTTVHMLILLLLLYGRPFARRGDGPEIICALTFILWFVAAPLWKWM